MHRAHTWAAAETLLHPAASMGSLAGHEKDLLGGWVCHCYSACGRLLLSCISRPMFFI